MYTLLTMSHHKHTTVKNEKLELLIPKYKELSDKDRKNNQSAVILNDNGEIVVFLLRIGKNLLAMMLESDEEGVLIYRYTGDSIHKYIEIPT